MSDDGFVEDDGFVPDDRPRAEGGATGGGGSDTAPSKSIPKATKFGSLGDFLKSWANTASLGAGPQIEGGMAAVMQDAKNLFEGEPLHPKVTPAEAYKAVRDLGETEHAQAENTAAGKLGELGGLVSTPIPVKALPKTATLGQKALRGAGVGAGVGALSGAINSSADLTKDNPLDQYAKLLLDAGTSGAGGLATGGALGGLFGAAEKPLRSTARRLPMDMLGVTTPARRAMERTGIYDDAGDALLGLVRPGRSGMRSGSLMEDALAELPRRGQKQGAAQAAIDAAAPEGVQTSGAMSDALKRQASPYRAGNTEDAMVAKRLDKEAEHLLGSLGSTDPEIGVPLSLAEAEAYKQRFGPAASKKLKMAAEPAAKTTAMGDAYTALRRSNEDAAQAVSPDLAAKWKQAKRQYGALASPLEGAGVSRSGMESSDFALGDVLSEGAAAPGSLLSKLGELPGAGLVKVPLDLAGRAYGRGTLAKALEFMANRAANNTGGGLGGQSASRIEGALDPWSSLLEEENASHE